MNYYNPYFYTLPTTTMNAPKIGLFSRLLGGRHFSFGSILSGTQKTLNIVNQTIPLVKQVQPMINNAKTMFKIMNEFKKSDKPNNKQKSNHNQKSNTNTTNNYSKDNDFIEIQEKTGPTFFM